MVEMVFAGWLVTALLVIAKVVAAVPS